MKFVLRGINFCNLKGGYDFVKSPIPPGSTTIDDILQPKHIGQYIDSRRQCHTRLILNHTDLNAQIIHNKTHELCWFCRSPILYQALGMPIKYRESVKIHDTESHILKKQFITIRDAHTDNSDNCQVQSREWFETEGYYCSLNCIAAQLLEQPYSVSVKYQGCYTLLCHMASELLNTSVNEIEPSRDWRLLKHNGGTLTTEEWQKSIGTVLYIKHPSTIMHPTSYLYTVNKKF